MFVSEDDRPPPTPADSQSPGGASAARGTDRGPETTHPRRLDGGPAAKASGQEDAQSSAPPAPRIGVISDNHGYLDPVVLEIFAGVGHIIHAGDVMDPDILAQLKSVAPVTAVAGNVDSGELAAGLPREVAGEIAGVRFVVGHKRKRLLKRLYAGRIEGVPDGEAVDLVIYGHDHVAAAAWVDDTLFLNPGTAGSPDDEDDGPTVAIVEKRPTGLAVLFVPLQRRNAEEIPERPERPPRP